MSLIFDEVVPSTLGRDLRKVLFSFSNRFCPGQKLETSCGSLAYSAPEILLGDSYDAPAVGQFTYLNLSVLSISYFKSLYLLEFHD